MTDIYSEVYNLLAEYVFTHPGTLREDLAQAIEWFELHFWDDEYDAQDEDKIVLK